MMLSTNYGQKIIARFTNKYWASKMSSIELR
jgi:hypothetical protein